MNRYGALIKIVEVGSYTKAAQILGYTQPALSQMIASLEREVGITLLYRSRYGVRLTPEGERLFPTIQETVRQYEALRRMEEEIKGLDVGIVRIGTVSSISCHWLPSIIEKFWAAYPNVQLELRQGDYSSICEWVRSGVVDFGFVNPAAAKGLETMPCSRTRSWPSCQRHTPWPSGRWCRCATLRRSRTCCWRRGATASRSRRSARRG